MLVKELTDLTLADELAIGHPLMVVAFVEAGDGAGDACVGTMYDMALRYAPHAAFGEVDLLENPSIRGRLRIHRDPTVIFYESGAESRRFVGPNHAEDIENALREALHSQESDDV